MAGYPNLLMIIFGFLLGSFQTFHSNIEMYFDFMNHVESEKQEAGEEPKEKLAEN